jgi:hypothetical protein
LTWDDSSVDVVDDRDRLPHEAAKKVVHAIEDHRLPDDVTSRQPLAHKREKLLTMLHLYSEWYEHPQDIHQQMQAILAGRAPSIEAQVGHLRDRRPWLALAFS